MSVKRSPPARRGSLPDLPNITMDEAEKQITVRKRKQPEHSCCCNQDLQDFRKDITTLLDTFVTNQEDTLKFMRENISEIKSQLTDIKGSIHTLTAEQNVIKTQLYDLSLKNITTEKQLQTLESEIMELKQHNISDNKSSNLCCDENIVQEIQDRTTRMKNIILMGIPESKESNRNEDYSSDLREVNRIINALTKNCPQPSKIFRLGKYNPNRNRSIKLCFESHEPVKLLLRNKDRLPSNIKIFSDKTPAQQKYFKELKEELFRRAKDGEEDITIKYIKGTPKIVQKEMHPSKN